MNCTDFETVLHEFLDEALTPELQRAAGQHLARCADCRGALLREKALAQSLGTALTRAASVVSLDRSARREILARASQTARPGAWLHAWQNLIARLARPACAAALVFGLLLLFGGIHLSRRTAPPSRIAAGSSPNSWVIDVPLPVQTHVFQYQNGKVVDVIVTNAAMAHAVVFETEARSAKQSQAL